MIHSGPEHSPQSPPWPPEVIRFVNNLNPGSAPHIPEASIIDLHLTHGTQDRETLRDRVRAQLETTAAAYRSELSRFIHIGQPDNPLPDQLRPLSPPQEVANTSLIPWLVLAHKYDPEAAARIVIQEVQLIIEEFDKNAFEAAPHRTPHAHAITHALNREAYNIAAITTTRIRRCTTDPALARQFLESDYFAACGTASLRLDLHRHLVALEGQAMTEDYSENYTHMLDELRDSLARNGHILPAASEAIGVVTSRTPALIETLANDYPAHSTTIRLLATEYLFEFEEPTLTSEHAQAMAQIEIVLSKDFAAFTRLLEVFANCDDREVTPRRIAHLFDLLTQHAITHPNDPAGTAKLLITKYLPAEHLPETLAAHPSLVARQDAKHIAVERLTEQGAHDAAMALAIEPSADADAHDTAVNPIYNLLTIYQKTGDEQAFARAQTYLETAILRGKDSPSFPTPLDLHKFALARFEGGRKAEHQQRASEALLEMEMNHLSPSTHEQERAFRLTVESFLRQGDIEIAEQFAVRLFHNPAVRLNQTGVDSGYAAMLKVIDAYVRTGNHQKATQLVQNHLATDQPLDYRILQALRMIAQ